VYIVVQEKDLDELVTALHLDMKTKLQLRKHRQQAIKELSLTNSISNSNSHTSSVTSQNYFGGPVGITNMTLERSGSAALYLFKLAMLNFNYFCCTLFAPYCN
jgi:hypothetical protein